MCHPVGLIIPMLPLFSVGIRSRPIFAMQLVQRPRKSIDPYFSYERLVSCEDENPGRFPLIFTYGLFLYAGTEDKFNAPEDDRLFDAEAFAVLEETASFTLSEAVFFVSVCVCDFAGLLL